MIKLLRLIFCRSGDDIPTNNPGTGTPPPDDAVKLLKSIDSRLKTLEQCIDSNNHKRQISLRTSQLNT